MLCPDLELTGPVGAINLSAQLDRQNPQNPIRLLRLKNRGGRKSHQISQGGRLAPYDLNGEHDVQQHIDVAAS
jgi:hypothetical protein